MKAEKRAKKMNLKRAIEMFENFYNTEDESCDFIVLSNIAGYDCEDKEKIKNLIIMLADNVKGIAEIAKIKVLKELEEIKE
jgi:hypothetical protein